MGRVQVSCIISSFFVLLSVALQTAKQETNARKAVMWLDDDFASVSGTYGQAAQKPRELIRTKELNTEVRREVANGFKSRFDLPPDQFEARLRDILTRGNKDPASAQLIANGFGWGAGFASRANMFVNELAMAMYFDRSISICNSTCMFETISVYYDLKLAVYNDPSRPESMATWLLDESENCPCLLTTAVSCFASHFLEENFQYITDLKRFLHKSVLVLKTTVWEKIGMILRQAGFKQDKKFIGVHIRHGDKGVEGPLLPFEKYAKAVTEALGYPGIDRSLYIASDDPLAKAAMEKLLPSDVEIWQQFSDGSSKREYDDDSFFPLLIDVEALKMSEVFIGTHSSNVGSFIFHGRPASKMSISLDVPWEDLPEISSDAMSMRFDSPECR